MKRLFFGLLKLIGYWIMCIGLFAIVCPFLFPFPMWDEIRIIFDTAVFVFPIGFVIRFIGYYDKELFERILYLVKDTFVILFLASLPCLAMAITYIIYHKEGYPAVVKGLVLIAIGIVGYIVMDKYIKDKRKKGRKKERENREDDEVLD